MNKCKLLKLWMHEIVCSDSSIYFHSEHECTFHFNSASITLYTTYPFPFVCWDHSRKHSQSEMGKWGCTGPKLPIHQPHS